MRLGGVDGEWTVEARFCDTFADDGRVNLWELRIPVLRLRRQHW
jgi:hypothetical protein